MKIMRYFGTDGIRGRVGVPPISADWMLKLGWAIGKVLSKNKHGYVVIGKDTRLSGYMFESALEAGLAASGTNVGLLGPISTPGVAFLTKHLQADAGIVISASHNSYEDNGIKFFASNGAKLSDELENAIEEQLQATFSTVAAHEVGKAKRVVDASEQYVEFCLESFAKHLSLGGMKIVIDCANGANYKVAPLLFAQLGAKVISINDQPDGININVNCGSLYPADLITKVKELGADLGIAFDGDGDRVILVDHKGKIVNGDSILYAIANWYLESGKKIFGLVGTVMSNFGLERAIKNLGLDFVRTDVGDRYVYEELLRRNWWLGGENSGHIICRDLHCTGDGIIAALQVAQAMVATQRSLADLLDNMTLYPQVMINVPVASVSEAKKLLSTKALQATYQELTNKLAEEGRLIIRSSGTEPVMRIMVEGVDQDKIRALAMELEQAILGMV